MSTTTRAATAAALLAAALAAGACSSGDTGAAPATAAGTAAATDADGVLSLLDEVPSLHPSVDGYPRGAVVLRSADGGTAWRLPVLLATDAASRQHGLMEVTDLPDGTGMAFLFEAPVDGAFWMKDTLVPLDIAYVAGDRVVSTATMVPCTQDPCPTYPAAEPFDLALEVPAGFLATIGLDETWTVEVEAGSHGDPAAAGRGDPGRRGSVGPNVPSPGVRAVGTRHDRGTRRAHPGTGRPARAEPLGT